MTTIKQRVEDYCDRTGATRKQIAEQLGFSRQTFRAKLDGMVEFKVTEAMQLAEILGCSVDDFRNVAD